MHMPELKDHPYEHQLPRRPRRLPRRTEPPPERAGAPDLRLFLFAGLVLLGIVAFVAIPYAVQYLLLWLTGGG
jgi:hypothetical protein